MNLGLCTISNKEASVESVIERAAAAGYRGVEIWGKEPHVGDGSVERCESIQSHAAARDVPVAVYGSYLRIGTDEFDERLTHELDIAEHLDAESIRVWAGTTDYEDRKPEEWEAAVADLRELTSAAADRGIAVTVEKHSGSLTNSTTGARRLIEAVDDEKCGLNWQPSFSQSAADVLADARSLAPLSNNVHVQAVPRPGTADRCLLAEAHFDVPAILSVFEEDGFDGWINVEFVTSTIDYETAITRDAEYLRSILEGCPRSTHQSG